MYVCMYVMYIHTYHSSSKTMARPFAPKCEKLRTPRWEFRTFPERVGSASPKRTEKTTVNINPLALSRQIRTVCEQTNRRLAEAPGGGLFRLTAT